MYYCTCRDGSLRSNNFTILHLESLITDCWIRPYLNNSSKIEIVIIEFVFTCHIIHALRLISANYGSCSVPCFGAKDVCVHNGKLLAEKGLFCMIKNDVRYGAMVCRKVKCSLFNGILCNGWNIPFPLFDLSKFPFS